MALSRPPSPLLQLLDGAGEGGDAHVGRRRRARQLRIRPVVGASGRRASGRRNMFRL
ncbi:hypothetical protein HMPREF9057_00417 [Actinomyces sp. oral taxon 171 str. F0337]|nr:hypothetical protein HMPREF9057_00417 [Actinomyces sp. oral taxon 171 str. F0337]